MTGDPGIARPVGVMALGTIASRATGFLRLAVMVYALGLAQVADAYNLANVTPNIVYELLLGGVLTSVVVPLIVQARRDDGDEGAAFASSLLIAVMTLLGTAVVVLMVFAPQIVSLYSGDASPEHRRLATTLLRWFLPQVLFYGVGATVTAILNTRRVFGVPMFAPVLNNLVVIATGLTFAAMPGEPTVDGITSAQVTVLGAGTTLGVVLMTAALLPSLRRAGFRVRWSRTRHPHLGRTLRLGGWVLLYVATNQLGLLVVIRLASNVVGGWSAYTYAFILFQLPHSIVSVSLISALLPRLSEHAVHDRVVDLRADVDYGLRLVSTLLVPAAVGLAVLAGPLAVVVLSHGESSPAEARFVGQVLTVFACGLASFSTFQLYLRVYYSMQDTRTPALVNLACVTLNIAVDLALFAVLDGRKRVLGLAAGHAVAYTVGVVFFTALLRRRIGARDSGDAVAATVVRVTTAAGVMGLAVYGASRLALGLGGSDVTVALLALLAGVAVGVPMYLVCAHRLGVTEVRALAGLLLGRAGRSGGSSTPGPPPMPTV